MENKPKISFSITALDIFDYYCENRFEEEKDHEAGVHRLVCELRLRGLDTNQKLNLGLIERSVAKIAVEYNLFRAIGAPINSWVRLNILPMENVEVGLFARKINFIDDSIELALAKNLIVVVNEGAKA